MKIKAQFYFFIVLFGYYGFSQVQLDSLLKDSVMDLTSDRMDIDQIETKDTLKIFILKDAFVTGDTDFTAGQVLRFAGLKLGEPISVSSLKIPSAIKKLMQTNQFSNVNFSVQKIEGNKLFLNIELIKLKELSGVSIKGLPKSKKEDFLKKSKLEKSSFITLNKLEEFNQLVKNEFIKKGYLDTKTQFNVIPLKEKDSLNIKVVKGPKVKIKKIIFLGNESILDSRIKRKVFKKTKTYFPVWSLIKPSRLIEADFAAEKQKLIETFQSMGYRDAAITNTTVTRVDEKNITITLAIDQGQVYRIGNIQIIGNSKYSNEQLYQLFGYKKGDSYDYIGIKQKISGSPKDDDIHSLYLDNGYLFSTVDLIETLNDSNIIDLTIQISEGDQARFNRITFSGNTTTFDRVITREIRTLPGELFNKSDIKRTYFQLAQLGFFEPAKIQYDIKPNPNDGTVDVDWKLEEKSSSQVTASAGAGNNSVLINLGLTFNNFSARNITNKEKWNPVPLGDGQQLSLNISVNQFSQSLSLGFTEPWWGGDKPKSLSASVFGNRIERPSTNNTDSYVNILGVSLGTNEVLEKPDNFFSFSKSISYRYSLFNNFDFNVGGSDIPNAQSNNLAFNFGIARRSAGPDPMFPTAGSQFGLNFTLSPPYSLLGGLNSESASTVDKINWLEYYKIKADINWYQEVIGKLVLRTHAAAGMLGSYNNKLGTPLLERFFIGGSPLPMVQMDGRELIPLRGYENTSNVVSGGTENEITPFQGGTIYNKLMFELRYPITMNETAKIWGLGFAEAASISNSWSTFLSNDLKRSAGLGVRVFMAAFGVLGFDYGYGFDSYVGGNKPAGWNFHFILGQNF